MVLTRNTPTRLRVPPLSLVFLATLLVVVASLLDGVTTPGHHAALIGAGVLLGLGIRHG